MLPLTNLGYVIDVATWNKPVDLVKAENRQEEILNGYITREIHQWTNLQFNDIALWEDFRDDFAEWDLELFKIASRSALKALRTHLVTHGVWVKKATGLSFAKALYDCLKEETQHE
jgi:hypothetical protein